jgi:pimeloyl-ACP methyl ester carboxylesterase
MNHAFLQVAAPNGMSRVVPVLLLSALLCSCAPLQQYRTKLEPCASADLEKDCHQHTLQEFKPADPAKAGYLLGFIEIDDQGQLYGSRRDQLHAVIEAVANEMAREGGQDILNVVFVHGWKHNAAPGDENIATFRAALARLADTELAVSSATGAKPRRVFGVYIGWRGLSVTPKVLKQFSFWDRKNTAHEVGQGDVTEVLNRLDDLRQVKDSLEEDRRSESRLVVVGHSFGGAVVFSALKQQLASRFLRTVGPVGVATDAEGFGNLVVLINPAFQAQLYASLHDISQERGSYFPSQLPLLAVLTSEGDDATRLAFPAGRWFSTLFEKEHAVTRHNPVTDKDEVFSQKQANRSALGHFEPYRTHYLEATGTAAEGAANDTSREVESVLNVGQAWENDAPGGTIAFPGSKLTRTSNSAGRNPYLVIRVDQALINDHNHISDDRVAAFITHLILVAGQSGDLQKRSSSRARGLSEKN